MSNYMDDDFVVHGSKSPFWEKPGYLSNTELTLTSRRLSKKSLHSPGNSREKRKASENGHSEDIAGDLVIYGPDNSSMKKSVTFNRYNSANGSENSTTASSDPYMNGNMNGDLSSNNGSDYSSGSVGMAPKYSLNSQWYTQPLHLHYKKDNSSIANGISNEHKSSHSSRPGSVGTALAEQQLANGNNGHMSPSAKDGARCKTLQVTSVDALAREFFPLTLGAAYTIQSIDPSKQKTHSPPAKGLPKPNQVPWKPKRSKSPSRKNRPGSAHSSSSSASRSSLDKMYLMSAEAPNIGSSTVLLSSPYQSKLARLRMDRLRIEEEHLLEVKRQEELERIRGPLPKWYELKTPRFHYESKKNTELLQSKPQWQDIVDYRNELERASKEYQQHLTHH